MGRDSDIEESASELIALVERGGRRAEDASGYEYYWAPVGELVDLLSFSDPPPSRSMIKGRVTIANRLFEIPDGNFGWCYVAAWPEIETLTEDDAVVYLAVDLEWGPGL